MSAELSREPPAAVHSCLDLDSRKGLCRKIVEWGGGRVLQTLAFQEGVGRKQDHVPLLASDGLLPQERCLVCSGYELLFLTRNSITTSSGLFWIYVRMYGVPHAQRCLVPLYLSLSTWFSLLCKVCLFAGRINWMKKRDSGKNLVRVYVLLCRCLGSAHPPRVFWFFCLCPYSFRFSQNLFLWPSLIQSSIFV